MAIKLQPLTLQITSKPPRLHTQLLAAWPRAALSARRTRAIRAITSHIKDALPGDYQGDISVFLSNEIQDAHPENQGFLYHLTRQNIITHHPVREANQEALLYIHYETALAMDEIEQDQDETVLQSRIEQIKQWQRETVKSVLQCMADTALSMEAQTALRGAMAGLNKLGALLNKTTGVTAKQTTPASKQAAQKAVTREIASTLSNLRSSLNVASNSGVKPPSKAQLAIRQQLKKLSGIVPEKQKTTAKATQTVKAAQSLKSAPQGKVTQTPRIPNALQKSAPVKAVHINIKAVRVITTQAKPVARLQNVVRAIPRLAITPARVVTRIIPATKTAAAPPRFTVRNAVAIVQNIAQRKTVTSHKGRSPINTLNKPTTNRFQINRTTITTLRITPAVIAAHASAKVPLAKTPDKTVIKSVPSKLAPEQPVQTITAISITAKNIAQVILPLKTAAAPLSNPAIIPQRISREPARYAAMTTSIASPRQIAFKANHLAPLPISTWNATRSTPLPVYVAPTGLHNIAYVEPPASPTGVAPIRTVPPANDAPIIYVEPKAPPIPQPTTPPIPTHDDVAKPIILPIIQPDIIPPYLEPRITTETHRDIIIINDPAVPPAPHQPQQQQNSETLKKTDVSSPSGDHVKYAEPVKIVGEKNPLPTPDKPVAPEPIIIPAPPRVEPILQKPTQPIEVQPPVQPPAQATEQVIAKDKLADKAADKSNVVELHSAEQQSDTRKYERTTKREKEAPIPAGGAEIITLKRDKLPKPRTLELTEQYVDRDRRYSIAYGRTADGSTAPPIFERKQDIGGSGSGYPRDNFDKNAPTKPNRLRFRCPCTGRYL